jgi:Ca-activated chloride channel homolog
MNAWSIQFESPAFMSLLVILVLLGFWLHRRRKRLPALMVSLPSTPTHPFSWRIWSLRTGIAARYMGMVILILALSRPILPLSEEKIETEAISIAMVIDISSSMLAMDFEPNRLEAAKAVAGEFIGKRKSDVIALVPFAGESYTAVPLTHDHKVVLDQMAGLECGWLEDGTAIGMGLGNAINRLKEAETRSKVIILLTDGVNNAGYVNPETAGLLAAELGIKIYCIGIGSQGEALSPISRRADGQYVFGYTRVELDESLLQAIAGQTGGEYFRADDLEALKSIYATIDALEKSVIRSEVVTTQKELFSWFVCMAGICFLLDLLFSTWLIKKIW